MRLAVTAAGFGQGEADALRRALSHKRAEVLLVPWRERFIEGCVGRGYPREYAEKCFEQFKGFSHYGFPESHSASFALIAYASAYVKCYHPAAFAAALLNSQPMGFYAPHTIVEDAKRHGVVVRPIDVRHSDWDATLEDGALRIGLREVKGLQEAHARALVEARGAAGFQDLGDLARRSRLPRHALERLARSGALDGLSRESAAGGVGGAGARAVGGRRPVPRHADGPLAGAGPAAGRGRAGGGGLPDHRAVAVEAPAGADAAVPGQPPGAHRRPPSRLTGEGPGPHRRAGHLPAAAADREGGGVPLAGGRDRHLEPGGAAGDLRARPPGAPRVGVPPRRGQGGAGGEGGEPPGFAGDGAAAPVLSVRRAAAVDPLERRPHALTASRCAPHGVRQRVGPLVNADPRARIWTRLEPWAALLAVAWCAFRLARGIGPDPFYNSDSAVPILLMQGLGDGPFTLYYPRQDRYGMWPFLLARAMHLATPEAIHVSRRARLLRGGAAAGAAPREPGARAWRRCSPAGAQPRGRLELLPGRAALPLAGDHADLGVGRVPAGLRGQGLRRRVRRAGRVLRLRRAVDLDLHVQHPGAAARSSRSRRSGCGPDRLRIAGPLVALGLSALAEGQIRRFYNAFCKRTFGERFVTVLRLDRGHFRAQRPLRAEHGLGHRGRRPAAGGGGGASRAGADPDRALQPARRSSCSRCVRCRPTSLVHHFRENLFAGRYFSFCAFWAVAPRCTERWCWPGIWPASGEARCGCWCCSRWAWPSPRRRRIRWPRSGRLAARLVGPAPRLLLADYWDVYVPASLAPPGMLLPLGREGNTNRFPAMQDELRPGRTVLATCALDAADGTMTQYGALLRRTPEPPIDAGQGGPWCLHAVERPGGRSGAPVTSAEDGEGLLVHRHAGVVAPQRAQLDEEAVGQPDHPGVVEQPLRGVDARRVHQQLGEEADGGHRPRLRR